MGTPLLVHEAPTLFEAGVEDRYDTIVAITAPGDLREHRRPGRRRADGAPAPGVREGRAGRRRLRELGHARGARRLRRRARRAALAAMRRVRSSLLSRSLVVTGAAYAYVDHAQPGWWVRLRYPLYYRDSIVGYGQKYHLDPALIAAVVYEESRFKANSRSSAGAIGLMQLLPSTARGIATHTGGTKFDPRHDLYDADLNIRYGSWYLPAPEAALRGAPRRGRPGPRRLQRRRGQRRRLDRRDARGPAGHDPVPSHPRIRRGRPPPADALPPGVRRASWGTDPVTRTASRPCAPSPAARGRASRDT